MSTNHHEKREDPLVELGYEIRDINYNALGKVSALFVVFSIGCFALVGLWFFFMRPNLNWTLNKNQPIPAINVQTGISVRADIATLRQHETEVLSSTGPNPDGTSHIPIDQAMDIIAKRGLGNGVSSTPAVSPGNIIKQNAIGPGGGGTQ